MFWNTFINQSFLELLCPIKHNLQLIILQVLVVIFIWVFDSVCSFHEFPRADVSSLALSLLVAGISMSVTVFCDEDVGEVSEDEIEDLVDKPGTTST